MAKTAEFRIQIDGIEESISAIEELNKRLDNLEAKVNNLQNRQVNINTSYTSQGGGASTSNRASQLSEEEKLTRQILQLDEKRTVYQQQLYQSYLASKDLMKETLQDQKQIAASERLTADQYTNTMAGMKQQLADIKTVMQTVDLSDTGQFDKLTQKANELTNKLKEIEQSYGQFGRNVGNYANGVAEGIDKALGGIEITIDGVTKKYDSLRQATVSVKNELGTLEYQGKQNTTQYKQLSLELEKLQKAQLRLNSAMNDAKASSKGMDNMLDMMESFVAVNQATRGMSSLFGVDTSKIQESIQKLVGLQNALQGIEKIRQQLNTQEGLGKVFASANKQIDTMNFSLKRTIVSLYGTSTAARAAAVGVNALSAGLKMLGVGLVVGAITLLVEGISKLSKSIQDWVKGNADLVSSEKLVTSTLERTNEELQKNLDLLEKKYNAGELTRMQMQAQSEEEYARAIEKTNELLERQLQINSKRGENKAFANAALGNTSIIGDTGVTTFGGIGHRGIDESIKSLEEAEERWKRLKKAVEEGTGVTEAANSQFGRMSLSASDARDELNHIEQVIAGGLINSMRQFDLSTQEGRRAMADFVKNIQKNGTELQKSVLFRLGDVLGQKNPELANALNGYLNIVGQFVDKFNTEAQKMNVLNLANNIIKSADPNSRLKEQLAELEKEAKNEGQKYSIAEVGQLNEAIETVKKQLKENSRQKINTIRTNSRREQSTAEEAQRKINELTISLMKDGLLKQLRQLDEQNRQEMNKIRQNGKRVEDLMKLQAQKYQQDRKTIIDEYNRQLDESLGKISISIDEADVERLQIAMETIKETALSLPSLIDGNTFRNDIKDLAQSLGIDIKNIGKAMVELKEKMAEPMEMYIKGTDAHVNGKMDEYYKFLLKFMETLDAETKDKLLASYDGYLAEYKKQLGDENKAMEKAQEGLFYELEEEYFKMHSQVLRFIERYEINPISAFFAGEDDIKILALSQTSVMEAIDGYYDSIGEEISKKIDEIHGKRKEIIDKNEIEEVREVSKKLMESLAGTSIEDNKIFSGIGFDLEKYYQSIQEEITKIKEAFESGTIDETVYEKEKEVLERRLDIVKDYQQRISDAYAELEKKKNNGEIDESTYQNEKDILDNRAKTIELYEKTINEIQVRYQNQRKRLIQESLREQSSIYDGYYQTVITSFREMLSKMNNMTSTSYTYNKFGFIDVKKTQADLKAVVTEYENFRKDIEGQLDKLTQDFKDQKISPEVYGSRRAELQSMSSSINEGIEQTNEKIKNVKKDWKKQISETVQILGQALVDVMGSIGDIQDAMLERQLEKLDEYNEKLEEKLQKQKDITQRYADDVKDIEDELETARGDRRQYLIDQLNEQMRAQRESLAQEQQIEKEQEKLEAKKKKLEDDANKRRKAQAITTALINAALAITNAAVNMWPQPAISMIAAATVTTAAQIAAIRAAKYEKGGLLKGKSHREGGIPVGNTGIEVEGKEYIIRKESTTPNIDLLNYINKSKRKLSLEDFIDFYGTKKMSSIIDSSKPRYASGGQLPTLRTDINTDTRMMQQMEQWNNRPVVVSVVDIVNKSENLRNTQVLAGLNPKTL